MNSSPELKDDVSKLKQLGSKETTYKYNEPSVKILETFPNKYRHNQYEINLKFEEFTSLCPKTGQPDFAELRISYRPKKKCVETKSLKLYLFAYRNYGSFMETIANKILEDLINCCEPHAIIVEMVFKSRGGIILTVRTAYEGGYIKAYPDSRASKKETL